MTGKLIVIESGTDSSGKATQTRKLYQRLIDEGYRAKKVEFPDYDSDSSALIKMYLGGEFGDDPADINSYAASTFFAVDRYASYQQKWKEFYLQGGIIVADRYTTSNMVHQACKFEEREQKVEFLEWLRDLEYNRFNLPEPDCVLLLDVPPDISQKLMYKRNPPENRDIHENDLEYLKNTYQNALWIAKKYNWKIIECTDNKNIKTVSQIHKKIYSLVKNIIYQE
ncbi:MAG: dTMP kinase [Halanaerobiales bacterium]